VKRQLAPTRAFSLIEITMTLGITGFALVAIVGLLPLAIEQSHATVNETRGAQLARMVFSTLAGENFASAECFGAPNAARLDLSALDASSPPVVLFASYDARANAGIVRAATPPPNAEYRLELRFEPVAGAGGGTVRGSAARLRVTGQPATRVVVFEGAEFLGGFQRAALAR